MRAIRTGFPGVLVLCVAAAGACSANGAGTDVPPDATVDVVQDLPQDVPADVPQDVAPDLPPDVLPDVPPDVPEPVIPEFLGGERPSALYVPDDYTASKSWPLIVLLHGYSVSGLIEAAYLGITDRVTAKGFVLLTPDGRIGPNGYRFWNAFDSCCNFDGLNVDDAGYVQSLVAEAKAVLNIDPDRVLVLGHSNGGFMAFRMACDASDVIAGIGSLAGSIPSGATCTPAKPVSVLIIHGTADDTIGYAGGTNLGTYPGAEALFDQWKTADGPCTGGSAPATPRDFDDDVAGDETTPSGETGCREGSRVDLWRLEGSGHAPAFTDAFKDAVLDHLLSMRRIEP